MSQKHTKSISKLMITKESVQKNKKEDLTNDKGTDDHFNQRSD